MTRSARRLDRILTDFAPAATLVTQLAAARRAAQIIAPVCAEIVPEFDPLRPGNCDLRGGVLRVRLRSGSQSTKLRQAVPRLLARLQDQGLEVNEIKVAVQLGRVLPDGIRESPNSAAAGHEIRRSLGTEHEQLVAALYFSKKLALTFPESELGRAASRLARSVDAQLARMRESNEPFYEQNDKKNND